MRNVEIKNFRCYENKSIEFRSGINLLIGDNSVGKTSLLRACNLVMNAFFSGYSDENTVWKSADDNDFRDTGIAELPVEISFQIGSWDFPIINLVDISTESKFKIEKKYMVVSFFIRGFESDITKRFSEMNIAFDFVHKK